MTTSSITAALPGTASSTSRGQSCPSACAIGHIGPDQRDLVLYAVLAALEDLLALKLKSLLGAVPTVEKAAVGMHMHRPCRLTRADIYRARLRSPVRTRSPDII